MEGQFSKVSGLPSLFRRSFRCEIEQVRIIPEPADDMEAVVAHWRNKCVFGEERIRNDTVQYPLEMFPSFDEIACSIVKF